MKEKQSVSTQESNEEWIRARIQKAFINAETKIFSIGEPDSRIEIIFSRTKMLNLLLVEAPNIESRTTWSTVESLESLEVDGVIVCYGQSNDGGDFDRAAKGHQRKGDYRRLGYSKLNKPNKWVDYPIACNYKGEPCYVELDTLLTSDNLKRLKNKEPLEDPCCHAIEQDRKRNL